MCAFVGFDCKKKVACDYIPTRIKRLSINENESLDIEVKNVKYTLTNIAVINIDLLPKNGINTCSNDSITLK
jgi:hypothetical protein